MELTPLGKRLARVARSSEIDWKVLVENVPVWPAAPPSLPYAWGEGDDQYAPSQGLDPLLQALRDCGRAQGIALESESIVVTNGGLDALGLIARQLQATGARRAICAGPVLLSIAQLLEVAGLGLTVQDWSALLSERGWQRLGLGPGDVLYINTPHNPTGVCLEEEATRELLRDQQRLGFSLIFDLVYDSFSFGPERQATPLALVEDWRGIYGINSFSKNYGAPGLRVGWAVAAPAAVAELTARLELERIAVSTGAQLRATLLCRHGNASLVERVESGHRLVLDWAREHGIATGAGRSGTHAWLDLEVGDSDQFGDALMAEERIVITTGANYFPRDQRHIRIPTGLPPCRLEEALPRIASARHRIWRHSPIREARHGN